jgi:alpha-L-rhamnosidase
MDVEVPVNTNATVYIPARRVESVKEGDLAITAVPDIKVVGAENGYVAVYLGSGSYHFSVQR